MINVEIFIVHVKIIDPFTVVNCVGKSYKKIECEMVISLSKPCCPGIGIENSSDGQQ